MTWQSLIPADLFDYYEFFSYGHAVEILHQSYPEQFAELLQMLGQFRINESELTSSGGNESSIPKTISGLMNPVGWREMRLSADLEVYDTTRAKTPAHLKTIKNYVDGHNIDYVKNRVAFDLEWNSKDQTFDRDLYAFRTFFECRVISVGVLMTRSEDLDLVFKRLGIMRKYGASTTWMGKLLYRLEAGRQGGCPVLAIGIKSAIVEREQ